RDGCPDTFGWVADLVKINAAIPGEMLCPSNPLKGNEKTNDLLGKDTSTPNAATDNPFPGRLATGACGMTEWTNGADGGGSATGFAATDALSPERASFVARAFFDKGIHSNYSCGWHFSRSV